MAEISDNDEVAKRLLDVANESLHHQNPDLSTIAALITAGRRIGEIPPGPPAQVSARAFVGVIEGVRTNLAGQAPFDVLLAERAALGVLGLPPISGEPGTM